MEESAELPRRTLTDKVFDHITKELNESTATSIRGMDRVLGNKFEVLPSEIEMAIRVLIEENLLHHIPTASLVKLTPTGLKVSENGGYLKWCLHKSDQDAKSQELNRLIHEKVIAELDKLKQEQSLGLTKMQARQLKVSLCVMVITTLVSLAALGLSIWTEWGNGILKFIKGLS